MVRIEIIHFADENTPQISDGYTNIETCIRNPRYSFPSTTNITSTTVLMLFYYYYYIFNMRRDVIITAVKYAYTIYASLKRQNWNIEKFQSSRVVCKTQFAGNTRYYSMRATNELIAL